MFAWPGCLFWCEDVVESTQAAAVEIVSAYIHTRTLHTAVDLVRAWKSVKETVTDWHPNHMDGWMDVWRDVWVDPWHGSPMATAYLLQVLSYAGVLLRVGFSLSTLWSYHV